MPNAPTIRAKSTPSICSFIRGNRTRNKLNLSNSGAKLQKNNEICKKNLCNSKKSSTFERFFERKGQFINYMKKQIILFFLFLLVLLSKNVLFHSFIFMNAMPCAFWQYFAAKLSVVLLIASCVFVSRRPWWTIAVLVLTDIWAIGNWMYYLSYGLFLSVSMISVVNNLHGFAGSLLGLWDWRMLWLVIPTMLYSAMLYFFRQPQLRWWRAFAIPFMLGILLVLLSNLLIHIIQKEKGYDVGKLTLEKTLPLYINEKRMLEDFESEYSLVRDHSIIGYMPLHIVYEQKMKRFKAAERIVLTEQESEWMQQLVVPPIEPVPQPNSNLVLILVESLEAWSLYYEGITPRIHELMQSPHVLFADKLSAQTRYGASGDGQLTFNTGLLPIQSGVACILYGDNVYPNIAGCYPRSIVVNPSKGTWNQHVVTYTYGYKALLEPESPAVNTWWNDLDVCTKGAAWIAESDSLSCAQVITVSMHAPFDRVRGEVEEITSDTPDNMRRYLTCLHYTDSCIGVLLDILRERGKMENTTIVISGDHNVFYEGCRREMLPYAQDHNLPISAEDRYMPFIVYSPHINEPVYVEEECYQMDIYPTIMQAIGCESYAWKGLGVNLFDSERREKRLIMPEEAYLLSDKLIRNNWFKNEPSIVDFRVK